MDKGQSKKEIYTYEADWPIYAMAWSQREEPDKGFRIAVGSFVEEYANRVQIVQRRDAYEKRSYKGAAAALKAAGRPKEAESAFVSVGEFDHPYPATKILWSPDRTSRRDLLATTGDYLRVWSVPEEANSPVEMVALLNNNKNSEYCAPLTSFDWNESEPNIVGTSSIDTTCTIWDLAVPAVKTQLIAHDKEVYDMAFARGKDIFASVGADGSARLFDLRTLEHSTIIYETASLRPLLRLAWNKQDPNYLATILADDSRTIILDVRVPSIPVAELGAHTASVNSIAWAPHSSCHLCTCADDCQVRFGVAMPRWRRSCRRSSGISRPCQNRSTTRSWPTQRRPR